MPAGREPQRKQSFLCVCVCVPYLFSFQDFGTPLETLGLPACRTGLPCLCLVELAFYICFNFLAISCIPPISLSPPLCLQLPCAPFVFTAHICQSNGEARGTLNVQLPLGLLSVGFQRVYYSRLAAPSVGEVQLLATSGELRRRKKKRPNGARHISNGNVRLGVRIRS